MVISRTLQVKTARSLLSIPHLSILVKIFFSCRHSTPDMPLRLVCVKDLARFAGKRWIDLEKAVGNVLMYRTLTDPKLLRCLPHRRIILYYIYGNLHGPLLNIILQKTPPANIVFTMYAGGLKVIQRHVRFPDSATYGPVYYNSRLLSFSRKSYTLIVVIPFSSRVTFTISFTTIIFLKESLT